MEKRCSIRLIAAVLNILVYFYIYSSGVQHYENSRDVTAVNAAVPLNIIVPQSIAQSKIQIHIWRRVCHHPIVRVRLIGPQIVVFPPFTLDPDDSSPNMHRLEIDVRKLSVLEGVYNVEASILRCHDEAKKNMPTQTYDNGSCRAESKWHNLFNIGSYDSNVDNWIWVHSPECNSTRSRECAEPGSQPKQKDYVFMGVDTETNDVSYDNLITLKDGITALSKPTTMVATSGNTPSLLKYFSDLSNYELVCWMGDDDARLYFDAFLDLFPLVGSTGQHRFKFKYIKLTDTSDPTKHFSDATHQKYKKCKILFVSYGIDRFDIGISPEVYSKEISTLINHIKQSQPDKHAWFLSARSSTLTATKLTRCWHDLDHGRAPDRIHTFNEETRRIFNERQMESFTSEPGAQSIYFMDNSDITEAFWHIVSAEDATSTIRTMETQIAAAVAMRCMEKIAQQVMSWRDRKSVV